MKLSGPSNGLFMCETDKVLLYTFWWVTLAQNSPVRFKDSERGKWHTNLQPTYFLVSSQQTRQVNVFLLVIMKTNQDIKKLVFDLDLKINHAFETEKACKICGFQFSIFYAAKVRIKKKKWLCSFQRILL